MPFPTLVAVVEDDADERTALGRVLRAAGFDVSSYASAGEFRAAPPPRALCLLLDVQLDGLSGVDLLRGLRAAGSSLPVIVSTAGEDDDWQREAAALGCVAILRKPFSGRDLVSFLRTLGGGRAPLRPKSNCPSRFARIAFRDAPPSSIAVEPPGWCTSSRTTAMCGAPRPGS